MWPASPESRAPSPLTGVLTACFLLLPWLLFSPALTADTYQEGRKAYIAGDYRKALEILEPLAQDGNSDAQKMLGIMYDYGHGVKASSEKALHWYLLSAEQGHPAVQYQVGAKYFRGDGVKQDYGEAARWWEMAANGGQVDAQFNLGLMYFRGLSIEADDRKAAGLFRRAAEQGHGHGQYSLAVMYAFGRGVDKDYDTALKWFERAAEQGVGQAQFNLGVFYENGYGVQQDLDQARAWYERAAEQGVGEADRKLAEISDPGYTPPVAKNAEETAPAAAASGAAAPALDGPGPDVAAEYDIESIAVDGIRREAWVLSQSPEHYTLQIGSVTREENIVNFIREHAIEENTAYIEVVIKGVTRYNALYGVYRNYSAANAAVEELPPALRSTEPWVRSFRMVHQLLSEDEGS